MNDCESNFDELEEKLESVATPLSLYEACDRGDFERVKELLEEDPNFDVNKHEQYHRTPLHMAARKGAVDICHLLLSHGADLEARTIHGCTAVYFAVLSAKVEMVAALADGYCADVNTCDLAELTPLHIACEKGYPEIVECLLLLGADPWAPDMRGYTPLDWAIFRGNKNCIALISPEDPSLDSARVCEGEDKENGTVQSSETVRATQIELATRNEGTKILKYPFTKENNTKPPPPYKIDIYDVH